MIIRTEPKDFFMFAVYLIFNEERPDPEDEAVRAYLAEKQLFAKRQTKTEHEGWNCEVQYFGGCYLGRHLGPIGEIQRKVMEKELVSEQVHRVVVQEPCQEIQAVTSALSREQLDELVAHLVKDLHQEASFETEEDGSLKLTMDDAVVESRLKELATAAL